MAGFTFLNDEQLRKLANVIYYQEVEAIRNIKFSSESELAKYLDDCKVGYESVLSLLNAGGEMESKYEKDKERGPIAHDIFSYVQKCINSALQTVRNYYLRLDYLEKISEHSKFLITALEELDTANPINVSRLAKEAVQHNNAMSHYLQEHQSGASKMFSKWLKESGMKFEDLVKRYQVELKFDGLFKDLEDGQKLKVYEKIIEASGRGSAGILDLALAGVGVAVLLFTAGMMVWDIFSSEHVIETATRDAVNIVAAVGGAMLGEVVEAAVATELVGVEGSTMFVLMAGAITSFVGAFLIGAFAGLLIGLIFNSGGTAPLSTDGHRCYVAPLPDGEVLARQIAHQY